MALNALGRIEVIFQFKDQSGSGIRKAKAGVKSLSRTVKTEGAAMNSAFMGAFPAIMAVGLMKQMAAGIGALLAPSIELQTSMRELQAFTGMTTQGFKDFNAEHMDTIKSLSLLAAKPVPELISGLTELRKKGLGVEDAMAALTPVTLAASIGHIDVAESAEAASVMFHTFGLRGKDLEFRMNQLAFAAANSAIGFGELPDLMSRIGQGVATANPSFEELIFNLATMRNIAPGAATSATQVRRALVKLGENRKTIGEILGVDTLTEGGQLRAISEMILQVAIRGDNLDVVMTKLGKTFGAKAAAPVAAMKLKLQQLMDQGFRGDELRAEFFKLRDGLVNGGNAINEIFNKMVKSNPTIMLDRLGLAFEQLAAAGGGAPLNTVLALADSLTGLVVWLTSATDSVNEWLTAINDAAPILGVLAGFVLKMLGTFGIMIGMLAVGRAATMLFGTAVQFAIAPMRQSAVTMSSVAQNTVLMTEAVVFATGAVGALGGAWNKTVGAMARYIIGARGVAVVSTTATAGVTLLGRAVTFLTSTLGVVGLAVGVITMLLSAFGGFESDLSSLNRSALAAGGSVVEGVRDSAKDFSGAVLRSAKRFEDMFKDPPPVLKTSTFDKLDDMVDGLLRKLDPDQAAKLEPALKDAASGAQKQFAEIREKTLKGEEISTESVLALTGNLDMLALRFQEAGLATDSDLFKDMAKELKGNIAGLLNFSEATEDRVSTLDKGSIGGKFAKENEVDAAKRQVKTAITVEQAAKSKVRIERALQAQAEARAKRDRGVFQTVTGEAATGRDVASAKESILSERDGILRKQLLLLEKVMGRVANRLDQPLDVNIANAPDDGRSLVPGALE